MKIPYKSIVSILFLLVCLIAGIFIGNRLTKRAQSRIEERIETMIAQHGVSITNEARSVVKKELQAFYPHVDSLAKASGIKIRQIERTTFIDHKIKYDTVPVQTSLDTGNNKIVNMSAKYECLQVKGKIDFTDTGLRLSNDDAEKMHVTLTSVQVQDSLTNIYYFKREVKKILFFRLAIGRKHYYSDTYSSCNGQTKTATINLIKR